MCSDLASVRRQEQSTLLPSGWCQIVKLAAKPAIMPEAIAERNAEIRFFIVMPSIQLCVKEHCRRVCNPCFRVLFPWQETVPAGFCIESFCPVCTSRRTVSFYSFTFVMARIAVDVVEHCKHCFNPLFNLLCLSAWDTAFFVIGKTIQKNRLQLQKECRKN